MIDRFGGSNLGRAPPWYAMELSADCLIASWEPISRAVPTAAYNHLPAPG